MRKLFAATAALIALSSNQGALATPSERPCLKSEEFQSIAVVLLPLLHKQAVTSCKTFLPSNAGLLVQSDELTARYVATAERQRTKAGDILARLLAKEMPVPMSGSAILPFVEGMVPALLSEGMDARTCQIANNVWTALAPLPPENIASTLGAILQVAADADGETKLEKDNDRPHGLNYIAICPYVATAMAAGS